MLPAPRSGETGLAPAPRRPNPLALPPTARRRGATARSTPGARPGPGLRPGPHPPPEPRPIGRGALEAFLGDYDAADDRLDLVIFAAPQLSLMELRALAGLVEGRKVHGQVSAIAATASSRAGPMSSVVSGNGR